MNISARGRSAIDSKVKRRWFRGRSVAIVGADGSGKSTIAQLLIDCAPDTTKYLYMGASIQASRIALPTSRLLVWLKRRRLRSKIEPGTPLPPYDEMSAELKSQLRGGAIIKALGVINRIAEEWYRQAFLWSYKVRGFLVVCDRHFLYEYFPDSHSRKPIDRPFSVRLHDAALGRFYPRPDLTLFLDAPAEVLFSRKPEWSVDHLERQRAGIIEQGRAGGRFVHIDATRSIADVLDEVLRHVAQIP